MSRTTILFEYKKKAINEMHIVLDFKIDTMCSFKDTNFYIYQHEMRYLTASFKWHRKTFSVKIVPVIEV